MKSDHVKKGFERAPHRSLLRATGLTTADLDKPFIAACNSYTDVIPGHVHLPRVARIIKQEIRRAGGTPFEFNDVIELDIPARKLTVQLTETELSRRRKSWTRPPRASPPGGSRVTAGW